MRVRIFWLFPWGGGDIVSDPIIPKCLVCFIFNQLIVISCLFVILIRISSRDTGKTMVDASLGEIMTTCEKITWLISEGEKWLKPEYRYITLSY